MGRIGRGWELTKVSLHVLRQDKELLVFPFISFVVTAAIWGSFVFTNFYLEWKFYDDLPQWAYYSLFFLFYLLAFFIAIYFNSAVVGAAMIRLEGRNPTLRDGFRAANKNIGRIFAWAVISATVGLVLRALSERLGFIGKIIAGALGIAWSIATYFVIPVLVFEKIGPWSAVKRSARIFKDTWGEAIVGGLGLGLIFFLLALAGVVGPIAGFILGGFTGLIAGLIAMILYWFILGLVASAAQSVLVAALYRYATTKKISPGMPEQYVRQPWTIKT